MEMLIYQHDLLFCIVYCMPGAVMLQRTCLGSSGPHTIGSCSSCIMWNTAGSSTDHIQSDCRVLGGKSEGHSNTVGQGESDKRKKHSDCGWCHRKCFEFSNGRSLSNKSSKCC